MVIISLILNEVVDKATDYTRTRTPQEEIERLLFKALPFIAHLYAESRSVQRDAKAQSHFIHELKGGGKKEQ